jgi:23S rRNA (guanosine2251-2'-O)-methyltransferase
MRRGPKPPNSPGNRPRFWGRHAVIAALANPNRNVLKLSGTRDALAMLDLPPGLPITFADVADLGRMVPKDAPHQGLVAEVEPLEDVWLGDLLADAADDHRPLVLLDQVTDPHNVGAVFRSAAAFGALGIITQDRHAPPESGVIARAASGALEMVPWVRVVNLSRALDEIRDAGFWRNGRFTKPLVRSRLRWSLAQKGRGCARMCRRTVMISHACRSVPRWKASTSPTLPR